MCFCFKLLNQRKFNAFICVLRVGTYTDVTNRGTRIVKKAAALFVALLLHSEEELY